ncbi:MAG: guanylate kinase [Candidatus Sumerlaeota bacterium]|nr:guanylate kinase [Candidatus Sumerlaeota bacterium]
MRFSFKRKGMLIVVSAPSGGGKSSVLRGVMERVDNLSYSISATSRPKRAAEVEGKDYYFIPREEFEKRIKEGFFLEWAEVHGHLYGTPRALVERLLGEGLDILLDVDVQGGLELRRALPQTVLIFVMPPSMNALEERLRARQSDSEDAIRLRLHNAATEIQFWSQYDYVVVNEHLEDAIRGVENIIHVERMRASRLTIQKT